MNTSTKKQPKLECETSQKKIGTKCNNISISSASKEWTLTGFNSKTKHIN
ncbi:hypothetical protein N9O84_02365 [Gammaproteobacteria bacterium]|nr:hypothetical protein [Gammaproteobacteria bacterium]